jgi:hypothetical protein
MAKNRRLLTGKIGTCALWLQPVNFYKNMEPPPDTIVETPLGPVRLFPASAPNSEARLAGLWDRLAKDHRYQLLVERTLGFKSYHLVADLPGKPGGWVQPVFLVEQDLAATAPRALRQLLAHVRHIFPRFLFLRMLMAGCAAGEGHPAGEPHEWEAGITISGMALPELANRMKARLIVWKDWPTAYRPAFQQITGASAFHRLSSMPATSLPLRSASFDAFLQHHLGKATRKSLRRKFRSASHAPLVLSVRDDLSTEPDLAAKIHQLYTQVLERSTLQFERLTQEFLQELGPRMGGRARFFLWHLVQPVSESRNAAAPTTAQSRLVACSICLVHDGVLYDEYLGLDYSVALDLHLYFVTFRDLFNWATAQGLHTYRSTPLNYAPKLRLGFRLAPLDLYVAATSPALQLILPQLLRWIEPTRSEPSLTQFPPPPEGEAHS